MRQRGEKREREREKTGRQVSERSLRFPHKHTHTHTDVLPGELTREDELAGFLSHRWQQVN